MSPALACACIRSAGLSCCHMASLISLSPELAHVRLRACASEGGASEGGAA